MGLACASRFHARPDRRPYSRHRRGTHRCAAHVLGGQGIPRSRRTRPSAVPRPPPEEMEAPSQQQPRQDPLPRRAGHGHPQGLAPPAEAPLQHQPDHRHREGRPRPSSRINVRLEKAQPPDRPASRSLMAEKAVVPVGVRLSPPTSSTGPIALTPTARESAGSTRLRSGACPCRRARRTRTKRRSGSSPSSKPLRLDCPRRLPP